MGRSTSRGRRPVVTLDNQPRVGYLVDLAAYTPVLLGEDGDSVMLIYNILPVGMFYDKRYGEIYVTTQMLQQIVENFNNGVPAYRPPVKIGHEQGDAAESHGTIIAMEARPEGLYITMRVDKETGAAIQNRKYRYMSAEIVSDYLNRITGENVGPVVVAGALVNQPANPYVEPFTFSDNQEGNEESNTPPQGGNQDPEPGREGKVKNMPDDERVDFYKNQAEEERRKNAEALKDFDARQAAMAAENEEARKKAEAAAAAAEAEKKKREEAEEKLRKFEEKAAAEAKANHEKEVATFFDTQTKAGIPPTALEVVREFVTGGQVMTFGDTQVSPLDLMGKFCAELTKKGGKIKMEQSGKTDRADVQLSETEQHVQTGEGIAAIANKGKTGADIPTAGAPAK